MDLLNKYVLCHWKNGEYEERWLRRINRKTSTQYISDTQRFLDLSRKSDDYVYSVDNHSAKRFNVKNGKIQMRMGRRFNPNGLMDVKLVEDFNLLNLNYSFENFESDISQLLEFYDSDGRQTIFIKKADEVSPVGEYLMNLFGKDIEIYSILDFFGSIDTTHENNRIAYTATKHHITIHGGNSKTISSTDNRKNTTISFWKFDNKIVWKYESGIGSW